MIIFNVSFVSGSYDVHRKKLLISRNKFITQLIKYIIIIIIIYNNNNNNKYIIVIIIIIIITLLLIIMCFIICNTRQV